MTARAAPKLWVVLIALVTLWTPPVVVSAASCETEILTGTFFSPLWNRGRRHTFNYTGMFIREAWPLNLAGRTYANWNWVGELFAADVTAGFGHVLAGPSLLARRWFHDPADVWRPYIQVGFGALYTDAYRDHHQLQLGEALEFRTTVSVGFHALLSRTWSWAGEFSFNHMSDGGLSDRNYGVHALGMTVGLARSF